VHINKNISVNVPELAKRLFFIRSPNDADVMNKPKNIRLQIQSTDRANIIRENNIKMDRIKTSRQRHNVKANRLNEIYNRKQADNKKRQDTQSQDTQRPDNRHSQQLTDTQRESPTRTVVAILFPKPHIRFFASSRPPKRSLE